MGRSYLEAAFRHKYLLSLPLVLGLLLGAVIALQGDREYTASGSFWADSPLYSPSTNGTTGGQSPPSSGEEALLSQYLKTSGFVRSVLEASPLADELAAADGPSAVAETLGETSSSISVSAAGPQLVVVSAANPNPDAAVGLVNSVLDAYELEKTKQAVNRAQDEMELNKKALDSATEALKASADKTTEQSLEDARAAYQGSQFQLVTAESFELQVVDRPEVAVALGGRKKALVFGAVGGALAGFTVSLIALILIMSRDRTIRDAQDAERSLGLDVVGSVLRVDVPHSARSDSPLSTPSTAHQEFASQP